MSGSGPYRVREGDIVTQKGANWEGSLGYLIKPGLAVSNKHVLPDVGAAVIHRVVPWTGGFEIGTVARTAKWVRTSIIDWILYIFVGRPLPGNRVDASLIALKQGVEVEPAFLQLPREVAEPRAGDKLFKRGRTTGVTVGQVLSESVDVWVDMGGGDYLLFTDVYMFSNETRAGDSGGPNYTERGVVGITFAAPESGSYGFGIKATNIAREFGLGGVS